MCIQLFQTNFQRPQQQEVAYTSHPSCKPAGQASIDDVAYTLLDRLTPTSLDKEPLPSIDRRYECGRRAYDSFGTKKFRWEEKNEYGVYRDESGHARSAPGDIIHVTKDDIRKVLESASLFGEGNICLPEQATSHTPTTLPPITLAPEIYTKEEINKMVTGICGAQEMLGDELRTLVNDTCWGKIFHEEITPASVFQVPAPRGRDPGGFLPLGPGFLPPGLGPSSVFQAK